MNILILSLYFLLASSIAHAVEYQGWIPLLPENIGGLEKSGEPSGMNMEQGGEAWSVLEQHYTDHNGSRLELRIVSGSTSPGMKAFESMKKFRVETPEKEVKTLKVSGYKAVLDLNKKGGKSNLLIPVHDETIVIISTDSFGSQEDIASLAGDVPLSDIADSIE
ncbi:MAG: hypothetical protein R6U13_16385 [Desulfatiglandaceae bacterium]